MEVQGYRFFAWFFGISFWIMFAISMVGLDQRDEARRAATTENGAGERVLMECVPVSRGGSR
jgi:hypothetical protein